MTNCTCPSGDGSLRWPCPVHNADVLEEIAAFKAAFLKSREKGAEPNYAINQGILALKDIIADRIPKSPITLASSELETTGATARALQSVKLKAHNISAEEAQALDFAIGFFYKKTMTQIGGEEQK